jgi:hypothetical protein
VIGYLKGKSSIWIAQNGERKLRNFLGHEFWARGYFVSAIGRTTRPSTTTSKSRNGGQAVGSVAIEGCNLMKSHFCPRILINASGRFPFKPPACWGLLAFMARSPSSAQPSAILLMLTSQPVNEVLGRLMLSAVTVHRPAPVIGMQRSIREWALRQGWGGRPVRQESAQGILVAALGMLVKHYGIRDIGGRRCA